MNKKAQIIPATLCLAAIASFWNVWTFDYVVYDDINYVAENAFVHMGLTWQSFKWAFESIVHAIWHPITFLSFMLDVEIYGVNPGAFHLTNLVFHVLNTLTIYWLLRILTGQIWQSFFVALLFSIHPLRVESVAWITERKDVLSMFFMLLAMGTYFRFVQSSKKLWWAGTLILFCLAVMSKPMIVTLPILLLLLDRWPLNRSESIRKLFREKTSMFILSFLFGLKNLINFKLAGKLNSVPGTDILDRFTNAFVAYVEYLGKMFYPHDLTPYQMHEEIAMWKVAASIILLLGISICAVAAYKKKPYVLIGWLWYLIALLPVIGLIQFTPMRVGDRFTYIPCIGILIMLVWGISDLINKYPRIRSSVIMITIALVVVFGFQTNRQTKVWQNTFTLFSHTLKIKPDLIPLFNNLANQIAAEGRFEQALMEYSAIIEVAPGHAPAYFNMGLAYEKLGEIKKARLSYLESLRLKPNHKPTIERLESLKAL